MKNAIKKKYESAKQFTKDHPDIAASAAFAVGSTVFLIAQLSMNDYLKIRPKNRKMLDQGVSYVYKSRGRLYILSPIQIIDDCLENV